MRQARPELVAPEWQVWAALLVIYVVWGSTYLAIRVLVETMPPLLSAGVRHVAAAAILFGILAIRRGPSALRLSRREWLGAGFVGMALLLGGNGFVMLGERDVPSALAALIIAVVPLNVVVLRLLYGEKVGRMTILGVVVGFAGVAMLIVPRGVDGTVALGGMMMIVASSISWSIGSYLSKRVDLPDDPLASTGAQMITGGIALTICGLLIGELGTTNPANFSTEGLLSLAYLIVFGSVIAYTAYTWLLVHAPVSKVATYAFVNPVVAMLLGWALLSEDINVTMLAGAAMIVVAVGIVVRTESRPTPPAAALEAEPAAAAGSIRST